MFIRVMKHAALRNDSPFSRSGSFRVRACLPRCRHRWAWRLPRCRSRPLKVVHVQDGKAIFGLEAVDQQVLNADGKRETKRHHRVRTVPMSDVWLVTSERQVMALSESKFVARLGQGILRVFKGKSGYGLEMALGQPVAEGSEVFFPTKALRKLLNIGRTVDDLSLDEFSHKHLLKIARKLAPPSPPPVDRQT